MFLAGTFFGQAFVPHVEQTGENSQNTDRHTEHLATRRNDKYNKERRKAKKRDEGRAYILNMTMPRATPQTMLDEI